jgi:hypothetical protein
LGLLGFLGVWGFGGWGLVALRAARFFFFKDIYLLYASFKFFYAGARNFCFLRFFATSRARVSFFWRDRADEAQKYGFRQV